MDRSIFKVDGIYDSQTLDYLSSMGIKNFSFDFRPRSLNFIQTHRFLEIIESSFNENHIYYLLFSMEKDFVIEKILSDLKILIEKNGYSKKNFLLEFDGMQTADFFNKFDFEFIWNFFESVSLSKIIKSGNLKGITLEQQQLFYLSKQNNLATFVRKIHQEIDQSEKSDIDFYYKINWGEEFHSDIFQLFQFKYVSIPINHQIEICYRSVNLAKIDKELKILRNLF